jgi:hypothetical protein
MTRLPTNAELTGQPISPSRIAFVMRDGRACSPFDDDSECVEDMALPHWLTIISWGFGSLGVIGIICWGVWW